MVNTRFGFVNQWGSKSQKKDLQIAGNDVTRTVDFSIKQTGFYLDYNWELPIDNLIIATGMSGGWGNILIESYQTPTNQAWNDIYKPDHFKLYAQSRGELYFCST